MRNAGNIDMECLEANKYQYIMKVMFEVQHPWFGCFKAHIKQGFVNVEEMRHPLLVETAQGSLLVVEKSWLKAVPRKQGNPAKHKRVCNKGTKPWLSKFEYVDYDPSLIKIGTRVKCRDKKIRTIKYMTNICLGYEIEHCDVYKETGKYGFFDYSDCDIMKILVEKKQDVPHCPNIKYNGYAQNVWHFWQGLSDKPPVDGDVKVEIWCRGNNTWPNSNGLSAGGWYWKWDKCDSDIIAFRIVGEH